MFECSPLPPILILALNLFFLTSRKLRCKDRTTSRQRTDTGQPLSTVRAHVSLSSFFPPLPPPNSPLHDNRCGPVLAVTEATAITNIPECLCSAVPIQQCSTSITTLRSAAITSLHAESRALKLGKITWGRGFVKWSRRIMMYM